MITVTAAVRGRLGTRENRFLPDRWHQRTIFVGLTFSPARPQRMKAAGGCRFGEDRCFVADRFRELERPQAGRPKDIVLMANFIFEI